jgi:hypothetical protein
MSMTSFHSVGVIPIRSMVLNRRKSHIDISLATGLRSSVLILSVPAALLLGDSDIA